MEITMEEDMDDKDRDQKIIEMFFDRSEDAIRELSSKYGNVCYRVAENILHNRLDSEECVNEAYLCVWDTISPQRPDSLLGYTCRIVRNLAIKKYHSNAAKKRNSYYDVALDEIEDCISSSFSLDDEVEAKEVASIINRFLSSLDAQSRIMFVRRYWYADSIDDLAKMFDKSKHYISVRLSRIREALKKYLIEEGIKP